jgi:very-short-patch-repair endonuclease
LQDGLILRDQAISAGMTRDQIGNELRRRRWVRVLPRVYAVGVDPRASRTRIRAPWLWAGADSVLAGAAAAWWHGLRASAPMIVEVIVPLGRRMTPQRGVRLIRSNVPSAEIVTVDWIRVTSVPRTCLDLARWKRDDRLEEAIRLGRLTAAELPPSLDKSRYRRGQVEARRAAAEVTAGPWSKPERIAHRLLADAGISGWVANQRAESVDRTMFPDIAFEDLKLAIEIDGREYHDRVRNPKAFEDDHEREAALVLAGWTVLRVTPRQLRDHPAVFVARVRALIDRLSRLAV